MSVINILEKKESFCPMDIGSQTLSYNIINIYSPIFFLLITKLENYSPPCFTYIM